MKLFFQKILKSHKRALRGILSVYGSELSFRVQFWWGVIVLSQIFYWPIGDIKRIILILLVFLMLITEILNTTFEHLFDEIEKRYRAKISYLKDILAGGALLMAIASGTLGTYILWPYIVDVVFYAVIESIFIVILIYLFRGLKKITKKLK